jgi:hypothetical protein
LIVRLLRIFIILAWCLALLAGFLAAALLLTGLLTRSLILLAGLVLVRHAVSFHGNGLTTAQSLRRSDKRKMAIRIADISFDSASDCAGLSGNCSDMTRQHTPEFRDHHTNTLRHNRHVVRLELTDKGGANGASNATPKTTTGPAGPASKSESPAK